MKSRPYLDSIFLDYSIKKSDQLASAIVHMVGFGLNITSMTLLIVYAAISSSSATASSSAVKIISFSLFGAFINLYYIFTVLFNLLVNNNAKKVFGVLRKATQYMVLAGTITPLCLVVLKGMLGWFFFGGFMFVCVLGLLNIILNRTLKESFGFIINIFLGIMVLGLLVIIFPRMNEFFVIWLMLIGTVILLGQVFKGMRGVHYNTALGHSMFVIANIGLFMIFFFYLAL